ncbi:MAG: hypothetical protein WAZ99_02090 [Rectinemataceae bacterium]
MKSNFSMRIASHAFALVLILFAVRTSFAQEAAPISQSSVPYANLAVELPHPVYRLIETAELRGALTRLSSVKPYTRIQVARFLESMLAQPGLFSASELGMVRAFASEFGTGGPDRAIWAAGDGKAEAGIRVEATARIDAGGVADLIAGGPGASGDPADPADLWHLNSLVQPYVKGAPAPWLSLWGTIGITYDKIRRDLYLPYAFTKEWDTSHNKVSVQPRTDGEEDYPTWSFDIRNDIAGSTESGSFLFRLSRFRRDWGAGAGSLSLSGTARPFVGLEFAFRPSEFFAVSHVVGSLGDWANEGVDKSTATDADTGLFTAVTSQKMLAVQRFELFPFPWLTLGATTTMVGAKRLELGYLSPMLFALEYQVMMSDVDNMGVQMDGQILLRRLGKLYASFYIDEIELSGIDEWLTRPRNMFAYQGGAKLDLPFLPLATLTAQYTKIEPFVYAHYPTWTAGSRLQVDTSYTHDGENLGYHLPPNSDEFLLRLDTLPAPGWRVSAEYSLVRHGDNPSKPWGSFVIFGNVAQYLDYPNISKYPDKHFLHDGLYDYNHIGRVSVAWRPAETPLLFGIEVPLELGLGYGLSYTYWDANESGEPEPDPSWKNIVEVSVKLFL